MIPTSGILVRDDRKCKNTHSGCLAAATGVRSKTQTMKHHLAILQRVYVDQIVAGKKTVECRLGHGGHLPHGAVHPGDLVWLKEVSGPVRAVVKVMDVKTIPLGSAEAITRLRREWNDRILAPSEFWQARREARVATLIVLGDLCAFKPFRVVKTDRRAWVALCHPPVPGRRLR